MPQRLHHPNASRPARRRVVVVLGGLLVLAAAVTASTYRTSSDPGSRVPSGAPPVQTAAAPAGQAPATVPAEEPAAPATARRSVSASADAAMPAGSAGQRVFIDPVTKRVREAEHDDAAALAPKAAAQRRALRTADTLAEPATLYGPDGMVGMAVPEELSTFVVATRTPDGRVVLEHATGPKAAQAKTRPANAGTAARKGEPNDR